MPTPTVPPSAKPAASTTSSMPNRTRVIGQPNRRCSPVIIPSRGPGPSAAVRYSPLPSAIAATPMITSARRIPTDSTAGSSGSMTSSAKPMTTTLSSVPNPGRSPKGSQISSTTTPISCVARPMLMGSCNDTPCAKTVHGALPRSAWTMNASPVPNSHSPARRRSRRAGPGRQRERDMRQTLDASRIPALGIAGGYPDPTEDTP